PGVAVEYLVIGRLERRVEHRGPFRGPGGPRITGSPRERRSRRGPEYAPMPRLRTGRSVSEHADPCRGDAQGRCCARRCHAGHSTADPPAPTVERMAGMRPRTRETPVPRCGRARRLLCTFVHMPTPSPTRLRRARGAVSVLFLTNGALMANLLPRYPEIKAELGLANSTYGLVLAAFPAGAILAGLGAATLIRRFGSAPVAVATTMLTAAGLLGAGWAPTALL